MEIENTLLDREMHNALSEYISHLYKCLEKNTYSANRYSFESHVGRKYIHVILNTGSHRSSHSWICIQDTAKFRRGTILKSNTWKAPATNFGRGDVFSPNTYENRADWTGVS